MRIIGGYTIGILAAMLASGEEVILESGKELHCGKVVGIRQEDGSGKCWLVTLDMGEWGRREIFIRTR